MRTTKRATIKSRFVHYSSKFMRQIHKIIFVIVHKVYQQSLSLTQLMRWKVSLYMCFFYIRHVNAIYKITVSNKWNRLPFPFWIY